MNELSYRLLVELLQVTHKTAYSKLKGNTELRQSEIDLLLNYFGCTYNDLLNMFDEWRKIHE